MPIDRVPRARIRVRAIPGSARPAVVGRLGDTWKIRIAAAPERGKANEALCTWLAAALGLPRGSVEVASGGAARDKVVIIAGLDDESCARMLDALAGK